ncbi:Transferase [Corchorus olitorius]|uniref:Transferase n=1 Tax=Corchorus olitorius TaxID=93759 RepID=A0A1R3KKP3_9ROSI|nr:Transferase [Corchorus olitorius]
MAHNNTRVEFLDNIQVSPPPGSVPTTSLPLTPFDLQWCFAPGTVVVVERLFFYEFPHPTTYFMETTVPTLKRSLSHALQYFFPCAANIMCPHPPGKPYILYKDGDDFVTFTVAESAADFNHVVANYPRDVKLLHPFVPQLPPSRVAEDGTRVFPILAIQVTVFPNSGVCIGTTYNHVAGDGKSFMHFMRCWASLNKSDLTCLEHPPPLINKDVIKVSKELELDSLRVYSDWISCFNQNLGTSHGKDKVRGPEEQHSTPHSPRMDSENNLIELESEDKVRATFVLGQAHVERLKQLVRAQDVESGAQLHISTFVVVCAFIWVCLIKSKESASSHDDDDLDKFYSFLFAFDGRNMLEIPVTYFGNCIRPCVADVTKSEIIRGENGIVVAAAKAIGNKIKEAGSSGLQGAEHWISDITERGEPGRITAVAGSPKLKVYEIDFRWGKPCKVELTHIDRDGAMALAECRDEQRGIEVALALNKNHMNEFISVFEQNLKLL